MVRTARPGILGLSVRIVMVLLLALPARSLADVHDPLDPFDPRLPFLDEDQSDEDKTPQQLILEGGLLLEDDRPLDARTKLLKALQKDPTQYRAHILLAGYYLVHVGHFRLALKYVRQAQNLFQQQHGDPPYSKAEDKREHSNILYLLAQVKLDLDNYQAALDTLDEYVSHGYYADWYAGTRAWVLMKLGNLDEAIKVARLGILAGSEPGRTLNMLGILLSMRGERQAALQVFKDAVRYEMSMGAEGQPATPLNNSGEVYKEMFADDNAESSWLRATGMPDGCDHVLPALNLAILYVDQLNIEGAKKAIDNFETCNARFPLKNGEEHRALVHLIRGRIDMHSGKIDSAIAHLRGSLENRQWFGKIGTSQQDMECASMLSLAQALEMKNNILATRRYTEWSDWFDSFRESAANSLSAWWHRRRAMQVLTKDLSELEDLYIRNTDSLIEYPTFGDGLAALPRRTLERRIDLERASDKRPEAELYYRAYIADNAAANGSSSEAIELLDEIIAKSRPHLDNLLKQHAILKKLSLLDNRDESYAELAFQAFALRRAALRTHGIRLPVNFHGESKLAREEIAGSAFLPDNTRTLPFQVRHEVVEGLHQLSFLSAHPLIDDFQVEDENLHVAVNKLADAVFVVEMGDPAAGGLPKP